VSETQAISLDDGDPAFDAAYAVLAGQPDPCGRFSDGAYCASCMMSEHARFEPEFALAKRVAAIEEIIPSLQATADEDEASENRRSAVIAVFGDSHPSAGGSGTKSSGGWHHSQMIGDRGRTT